MHVCMYVCMYVCMSIIYMHAYMHTYIQTGMHACIHTYMHTCIHACIRRWACDLSRTRSIARVRAREHARTQAHTCASPHSRACTHTHWLAAETSVVPWEGEEEEKGWGVGLGGRGPSRSTCRIPQYAVSVSACGTIWPCRTGKQNVTGAKECNGLWRLRNKGCETMVWRG